MQYKFQFNQEDLDFLCTDRPLVTSEIHTPNDFYGQASVLKEYVGFPNDYPLKVVLEHGLFLDDWIWDVDRTAQLPIFLSPSAHRSSIHHEGTDKPSTPIGFGFLYAIELYKKKYETQAPLHRKGTIVFPSHSTHHIKAVFDFDAYADSLSKLPDKFKPITVCIYWKDYLHGHHMFYKNKKFKVVTTGHMYEPKFFLRFYDICRQFKYATSNNIGTQLFLSVKSGCSFFYTHSGAIRHELDKNTTIGGFSSMFNKIKEESIVLFTEPKDKMAIKQLEFVDRYLGAVHLKTPIEIKKILLYAEILDKFYIKNNSSTFRSIPYFYQRNIPKLTQKISNIIKRCSSIA